MDTSGQDCVARVRLAEVAERFCWSLVANASSHSLRLSHHRRSILGLLAPAPGADIQTSLLVATPPPLPTPQPPRQSQRLELIDLRLPICRPFTSVARVERLVAWGDTFTAGPQSVLGEPHVGVRLKLDRDQVRSVHTPGHDRARRPESAGVPTLPTKEPYTGVASRMTGGVHKRNVNGFRSLLGARPLAGRPQARCLIVGEVAQAHDGSLGMAHAFIDAIAATGADAVKFQTHIAGAESTPGEPWRVQFSVQDESRYAYWRRMEFTEEQWHGLQRHATDRGLLFLSSPFSIEAVELLTRVGVAAWKVASGEVANSPMLDRMAATGLPFILSTGMSRLDEIDSAVGRIRTHQLPLAVLQCTSEYPCPPEQVGLNLIPFLRDRYDCPAGLSDHSGTVYPGLASVTLGAEVLEVHVTLSREVFGPDVTASVTTGELRQLVEGVRFIEAMQAHPVDKDGLADTLAPVRKAFTKSVVARMDLPVGTVLEAGHLTVKKPGTGIPAARLEELVGTQLRRSVWADQALTEADFERGA
jgi:N,N'-diacetyllegionaminate synthase